MNALNSELGGLVTDIDRWERAIIFCLTLAHLARAPIDHEKYFN